MTHAPSRIERVASRRSVLEIARLLLDHGADPSRTDDGGRTALMHAAAAGHAQVVDVLLPRTESALVRDHDGHTAFDLAFRGAHHASAALLRAAGGARDPALELERALQLDNADAVAALLAQYPGLRAAGGDDLLRRACETGRVQTACFLLQGQSPRTHLQGRELRDLLAIAAQGDEVEIVDALLARGADATAAAESGSSAFEETCMTNAVRVIQHLLERGCIGEDQLRRGREAWMRTHFVSAEWYVLPGDPGWQVAGLLLADGTRLTAAEGRHLHAADWALGARPERRLDFDDEPEALSFAITNNLYHVAKHLLGRGVRPPIEDASGPTLPLAASIQNVRVLRLVAEAGLPLDGALVNYCRELPEYPDYDELLEVLLEHCDPNEIDVDGFTPLIGAALAGHLHLVLRLLAAGADPNAKTTEGKTALAFALSSGETVAIDALLAAGADVHVEPRRT